MSIFYLAHFLYVKLLGRYPVQSLHTTTTTTTNVAGLLSSTIPTDNNNNNTLTTTTTKTTTTNVAGLLSSTIPKYNNNNIQQQQMLLGSNPEQSLHTTTKNVKGNKLQRRPWKSKIVSSKCQNCRMLPWVLWKRDSVHWRTYFNEAPSPYQEVLVQRQLVSIHKL